MKAYLINPFEKSVKEVEYSGDIEDIYLHLNCDIFDCCYPFDNQNCVFIDDAGFKPFQGQPRFGADEEVGKQNVQVLAASVF